MLFVFMQGAVSISGSLTITAMVWKNRIMCVDVYSILRWTVCDKLLLGLLD